MSCQEEIRTLGIISVILPPWVVFIFSLSEIGKAVHHAHMAHKATK